MIRLENVRKTFGRKVAVDDLTIEIPSGELFAFLGPNGAGKTTTIKMISGLLRPTSGRITVCDLPVGVDSIDARRMMAYIPDQPYLYDKLTGLEFMRFMAEMYDIDRKEAVSETDRLVDLFGMGDWIRELTEGYSHGMKQRVVLAATLLHHPKVIIVDEPLVGLDPYTSRQVKDIFAEEAARGTTIFLTTHVLSIAEETARRIGIIHEGRLRALGTMEELREQARVSGGLEDVFFKLTEADPAGSTVDHV